MRKESIRKENLQQNRQLPEELPGFWYNFESSEATLDRQRRQHWLANLRPSEALRKQPDPNPAQLPLCRY